MKAKSKILAAIDVGSSKICVALAKCDTSGVEVIAVGTAPAAGFRKSAVVDIEEAAGSVNRAVREAESVSGIPIKSAYAGIAGTHISCSGSYGATGIKGREVRGRDIDRAIEAASAVYVPLDREILHVLPSEFVIDGQDGIQRPMGMAGVRLEVKVQVLTAAHAVIENMERVFARAGLRMTELVFQPLASALAALRAEEMEQGVMLVDIGGWSSDMAMFKDGVLMHAFSVPVGSHHITNDIALGLKLPQKEAERLKLRYGASGVRLQTLFERENIEALGMSGKPLQIDPADLARVVKSRCEEIFELIKQQTEPVFLKSRPVCAVLAGGGSLMRDMNEMAEKWLGLPVRTGYPETLKCPLMKEFASGPQYAAAAGLLLYGIQAEGGARPVSAAADAVPAASQFASIGEALLGRISGLSGLRRLFSKDKKAKCMG